MSHQISHLVGNRNVSLCGPLSLFLIRCSLIYYIPHIDIKAYTRKTDAMVLQWLVPFLTCEDYFRPCKRCRGPEADCAHQTIARDRQINFFATDTQNWMTACAHCRPELEQCGLYILQIRRSSHQGKSCEAQKACFHEIAFCLGSPWAPSLIRHSGTTFSFGWEPSLKVL